MSRGVPSSVVVHLWGFNSCTERERAPAQEACSHIRQSLYCVALVSFKWRGVRARACAQEALFVGPSVIILCLEWRLVVRACE